MHRNLSILISVFAMASCESPARDFGGTGVETGSGTASTMASGMGGSPGETPTVSGTGGSEHMSTSAQGGTVPLPTCDSYCANIMKSCAGDNSQYIDKTSCIAVCSDFPNKQSDTEVGDSLACRANQAALAAMMDPNVHCPQAGPTGGDRFVGDMDEGVCGDGCAGFCDIALKACSAQNTYRDRPSCEADCRKFKDSSVAYSSTYYTSMENWKNDFGCRMYHLTVAAGSADAAKTHCQHIPSSSPLCVK